MRVGETLVDRTPRTAKESEQGQGQRSSLRQHVALAVREYTIALEGEDPPLRAIYPFLAYAHWQAGDHGEARKYAERARTMTPDDPRVREVLNALGDGR